MSDKDNEDLKKRVMMRILMPKIGAEDIEKLKSSNAFMLRATLPVGATFISAVSVPSIIDMMGFSGGGGPPAFAYSIDPDETVTQQLLLMTIMPEMPINRPCSSMGVELKELGVIQSMGMLLTGFEWSGSGVPDLEENYKIAGAHIFDTVPYVIPEMLKALTLQRLVQTQAQNAQAQDKPPGT